MGPALETFLTFLGIAVLVIAAFAWFLRPLWVRIWRFFRRWYEADRIREQALKRQEEFRKQAEQEVEQWAQGEPVTPVLPAQQERQDLENRQGQV
jgi:hypothetical protein